MAQESLQQHELELEDAKVGQAPVPPLLLVGWQRMVCWFLRGAASCWLAGSSLLPAECNRGWGLRRSTTFFSPAAPCPSPCPSPLQLAIEMKDEAIQALRGYERRCRELEAGASARDAHIAALEARLQVLGGAGEGWSGRLGLLHTGWQ